MSISRLRAANPAPAAQITDEALFARIVAQPGDPRLLRASHRRWRVRGLAVILAAVVFGATGGAFGLGVFSHASPKALFEADPGGRFSRRPGHWGTGQTVIPHTVRLATTFTVPGVGRFQFWIALSKPKGWLCDAIRQPDGSWADLEPDKYELGGPVPGCGSLPWQDAKGFAYNQSSMQSPGRRTWQIVYGYVPTTGHPVEVRDKVSGVTARIGDGRYFAIVMPLCKGSACDRISPPGYQLQTLNEAGWILVTDPFDPGE